MILVVLVLFLISCSFFDKDIGCKAKLFLMIANNTGKNIEVRFLNYKEKIYNENYETIIRFSDSSAIIFPQNEKDFIFDYTWTGNNECGFSNVFFNSYRIDVTVDIGDSAIKQFQCFPFDTTKEFQNICTDCVHEYSDTIIIE